MKNTARLARAGQRLEAYRVNAGYTLTQARDQLGCSKALLSLIEAGIRPLAKKVSYEAIEQLYQLTHTQMDELRLLYGAAPEHLADGGPEAIEYNLYRLFYRIVRYWEDHPTYLWREDKRDGDNQRSERFVTPADLDNLLKEGQELFRNHVCEEQDLYTRIYLTLARRQQDPHQRDRLFTKAITCAQDAITMHKPTSFVSLPVLYNNLGEVYFKLADALEGKLEEAHLLEEALEQTHASAQVLIQQAAVVAELRQRCLAAFEPAQKAFAQAQAEAPTDSQIIAQNALIAYNIGKFQQLGKREIYLRQAIALFEDLNLHFEELLAVSDEADAVLRKRFERKVAFTALSHALLGEFAIAHRLLEQSILGNLARGSESAFWCFINAIVSNYHGDFEKTGIYLRQAQLIENKVAKTPNDYYLLTLREPELKPFRIYLIKNGDLNPYFLDTETEQAQHKRLINYLQG